MSRVTQQDIARENAHQHIEAQQFLHRLNRLAADTRETLIQTEKRKNRWHVAGLLVLVFLAMAFGTAYLVLYMLAFTVYIKHQNERIKTREERVIAQLVDPGHLLDRVFTLALRHPDQDRAVMRYLSALDLGILDRN